MAATSVKENVLQGLIDLGFFRDLDSTIRRWFDARRGAVIPTALNSFLRTLLGTLSGERWAKGRYPTVQDADAVETFCLHHRELIQCFDATLWISIQQDIDNHRVNRGNIFGESSMKDREQEQEANGNIEDDEVEFIPERGSHPVIIVDSNTDDEEEEKAKKKEKHKKQKIKVYVATNVRIVAGKRQLRCKHLRKKFTF